MSSVRRLRFAVTMPRLAVERDQREYVHIAREVAKTIVSSQFVGRSEMAAFRGWCRRFADAFRPDTLPLEGGQRHFPKIRTLAVMCGGKKEHFFRYGIQLPDYHKMPPGGANQVLFCQQTYLTLSPTAVPPSSAQSPVPNLRR